MLSNFYYLIVFVCGAAIGQGANNNKMKTVCNTEITIVSRNKNTTDNDLQNEKKRKLHADTKRRSSYV